MKSIQKNLFLLLLFGIGMGFLESIVVVYLREISYPNGFTFPLVLPAPKIFIAEVVREICTIIMLVSIACIAGKSKLSKFSYFLYSFAVWDIFYYIGLKLFLDWPESLLTWDVLFLIPITWLGPVLAPVICSIFMIGFSVIFLILQQKNPNFKVSFIEWLFLYAGAFLIFITFIRDYSKILVDNHLVLDYLTLKPMPVLEEIVSIYVPQHYLWGMLILGVFCFMVTLVFLFFDLKRIGDEIECYTQPKEVF